MYQIISLPYYQQHVFRYCSLRKNVEIFSLSVLVGATKTQKVLYHEGKCTWTSDPDSRDLLCYGLHVEISLVVLNFLHFCCARRVPRERRFQRFCANGDTAYLRSQWKAVGSVNTIHKSYSICGPSRFARAQLAKTPNQANRCC